MEFSKLISISFLVALVVAVTRISGATLELKNPEEGKAKNIEAEKVLKNEKAALDDWDMELPVDDNFEARRTGDKRDTKDLDTAEFFLPFALGLGLNYNYGYYGSPYYYNNYYGRSYNYYPYKYNYGYRRWRPSYYY